MSWDERKFTTYSFHVVQLSIDIIMLYSFDWFKILNINIPCTFSNKGAEKKLLPYDWGDPWKQSNLHRKKMIGVTESLITSVSFLGQFY